MSNLALPFCLLMAAGLALTVWTRAVGATPKILRPLHGVTTLFDAGAQGDAYFNAQLRREVRAAGFRFVPERATADAIFNSRGNSTPRGGFAGQVTLRDQRGRVLWHRAVRRPPRSRVMAFASLGREMRAAK